MNPDQTLFITPAQAKRLERGRAVNVGDVAIRVTTAEYDAGFKAGVAYNGSRYTPPEPPGFCCRACPGGCQCPSSTHVARTVRLRRAQQLEGFEKAYASGYSAGRKEAGAASRPAMPACFPGPCRPGICDCGLTR